MATPQSCDGVLTDLSRHGDRPAVFTLRKRDSETWSYADLDGCVNRLAHGLRHAGLAQGDRAAIIADNGPEWIAAVLAIIRAGGVVVPLDVQLGEKALRHVFGDSTPRFVFTTKNRAERIAPCAENARLVLLDATDQDERSWRHLLSKNAGALPELRAEDHATLFYTSGTTGPPKGVPLTHRNLSVQIDAALATGLTSEDDHLLLPLPLHHVYPFVIGMLAPLTMGLTIVIPQSLTGPQIIRALREGEVNVIVGVPRLYRALYSGIQARLQSAGPVRGGIASTLLIFSIALRRRFGVRAGKILLRPLHRQLGSQLRLLASGGAALDPELAIKLEGLGWQVAIGYGLTETSPLLTFNLPGQAPLDTVGKPIRGVKLRINPKAFEKEERAGGPEGQGEVLARGPSVFTGYRNLEEKTREAFTEDGWFRTGDLGFMDDEGNLHLLGRVSTVIVTEGGKKVQPDDVEEAYAEEKAIREIGVLQKDGKLVALIVPAGKQGEQNVEQAVREAIERVSRRLPPYQRISEYALTGDAIQRTRLGKIRRHLLSERFEKAKKGEEGSRERLAGPMPIEEMSGEDRALLDDHPAEATWELLARRYKDKRLTPDSNPGLDLGIDSLEWLNLTFELRENAGVELTEAAITRIETIRDLLREVSEASEAESESQPLDRPEEILTDQQKRWLEPPGLVMRLAARILFFTNRTLMRTLFRVEAKGLDRLPENAQFVFAPNHTSYLDPPALAAVLSDARLARTYWGGWSVIVTRNAFTRFIGRLANAVPIDPERGAISSLAFGAVLLKRKVGIVWFPEGGLSRTGELQPFKPGIGIVLARFAVPVVPVFIAGTHDALPVGAILPRPRKVRVIFGDPLDPRELERTGVGKEPHERIVNALRKRVAALKQEAG
jgi:long-chain acyl-CoA synthetase